MVLDPARPPTPRYSKNGGPPREITVIDSPEKLGLPNCRGRITQGGAVIMAEESAKAKKRSTEEFYRQPEGVVVSGLEELKLARSLGAFSTPSSAPRRAWMVKPPHERLRIR